MDTTQECIKRALLHDSPAMIGLPFDLREGAI